MSLKNRIVMPCQRKLKGDIAIILEYSVPSVCSFVRPSVHQSVRPSVSRLQIHVLTGDIDCVQAACLELLQEYFHFI